jgi:hypothetical protein
MLELVFPVLFDFVNELRLRSLPAAPAEAGGIMLKAVYFVVATSGVKVRTPCEGFFSFDPRLRSQVLVVDPPATISMSVHARLVHCTPPSVQAVLPECIIGLLNQLFACFEQFHADPLHKASNSKSH